MSAQSSNTSCGAVSRSGSSPLPSGRGAALPSTAADCPSFGGLRPDRDTVVSLTAITACLLGETLNPDSVALAMHSASKMSKGAGVGEEEFNRVAEAITSFWRRKMSAHPMSSMYM